MSTYAAVVIVDELIDDEKRLPGIWQILQILQ
jgi:hypothetical protein